MKKLFSLLLLAMASMTLMAQTECDAITSFPWTEDFEGMTANLAISAECWTNEHISGEGTGLFKVNTNTHATNSTHQVQLPDMKAGTITRLTLPLMDFGQPNSYLFSIDVYRNGSSSATAEGLRIFAGDQEIAFISRCFSVADGDRVPAESTYAWYTYEFVIPVGGEQHITIQGESQWSNSTFFDNLIVQHAPTCPQPTGFHILDDLTTATSATIAWSNTDAEQYRVVVASGTDTLLNTLTTDTFCVVNGLQMGINYTLRATVTSVCGGDDESRATTTTLTVTTPCATISSLPWSEGFENYARGSSTSPNLPCWDLLNFNTDRYLNAYVSNTYVHTGSQSLKMNSCRDRIGYAILPEITADLSRAEISFWYRNENTSTNNGILAIGYMTDIADSTSFVALQEQERITTFTEVTQSLATVPTGARIAFRYDCKATNYILGIDDISIYEVTCNRPSDIHLVDDLTTTSSATIAWSAPDEGAEQYRAVVTSGTDTLLNTLTTDTFCLVSGLKSATAYTLVAAISSVCGEGNESRPTSVILTMQTLCSAISSLPWCEGFENYALGSSTSPNLTCWDLLNFNTGGNLNAYVSNTYVHTGSLSLIMNSYKNRMGYAILPEITADLSRAEISFWYRNENTSTNNGILAIGYMTDIADSTSFVALQELDRIDTFTEVTQSLATVPTGARIAFRYDCKATNYILGIDDISINSLTCQQPSNVHLVDSLTTASTATIAWSAPATGAEQYRIVVTNGTNVNDTILSTLTTDTFCLVALKTGTSYTLSATVTSVCGEEESSALVVNLTVSTPCELITTFPWTEDFEGMAIQRNIPAGCWTNEHISGPGTYLFMVTQDDNDSNTTRNAYLPYMEAGTITRLGLPIMDFGQPNTYRFSIDIYRNTSYAGCVAEGLRIFAGEEELGFISCNYTVADGTRVPAESEIGWYTYEFLIPVGGEQRIIIQGESQHGETTHFDNLVVDLAPSTPTALPAAAASDALRAAKFVRDGHIYIVLPDGTTFDATGRRM